MARVAAVAIAASLFASQVLAQIQPIVKGDDGKGAVDWSERSITATGIAAPNPDLPEAAQRAGAIRAATIIALRNALETVKGMYLNSSTTVANFMTTKDEISTSVSGYIQGFEQQGRTKYMSDGSVEVTLLIPIDGIGNLGDELYTPIVGKKPSVTKFEGEKADNSVIFTGLVIDCKGLNLKPALSPKIVDEEGREVYGSAYVTREWAIKHGIVGYAKEVDAAAKLGRVGDNPGKIKALKAKGENSTDVVISNDDAASVRSAADNLKFLSECRVVLVID
jgi:hypothetical protein